MAVLDRFDTLLEKACSTREKNKWQYLVDENNQLKELVLGILNFTALLIEYSCSRHIYGSIDHIITLLCVADLDVTLSGITLTTYFFCMWVNNNDVITNTISSAESFVRFFKTKYVSDPTVQ